MASSRGSNGSPSRRQSVLPDDDAEIIPTRQLEAFGRTVTATATHLLGETGVSQHYQSALKDISRELRRPALQRAVFSFTQTSPRDLIRSNVSVSEIQHRALSHVPDELLAHIPETQSTYSLFEGFRATLPDDGAKQQHKHGRKQSRGRKLLTEAEEEKKGPPALTDLKNEKRGLDHRLEMLGIRKNMCATEIREIDTKIANLNTMRQIVLDRLAGLEHDEIELEQDIVGVDNRLEDLQEELNDAAILAQSAEEARLAALKAAENDQEEASDEFMSQSIYQKIPADKAPPKAARRKRLTRRISMPILHESLKPGSKIRELQAHNDTITAVDFDAPFGTMVTAALDDTVRVWDLNAGRCMGMLEGHLSSVRCLQVEENIVATGSMDASIRLWDLNEAEYNPQNSNPAKNTSHEGEQTTEDDEDSLAFEGNPEDAIPDPPPNSMQHCLLHTLEAHVAEVTALHFRGDTLVSGSADKTLRQWDLQKGRCVQTLDVLWAAAQASSGVESSAGTSGWSKMGRYVDAEADFVGAIQVFDAALACGTADGMVRLWDLRSGQVHRSLVGHTGPVTSLQFDDVHLVTASLDRSIRIWDLRTGSIFDAFAHTHPITSMMFDARRIVAAAGEDVVKVYDKTDGRHWDCGPGAQTQPGEEAGFEPHKSANVEKVRIKDGYLVEGRKDGVVGAWSC